MARDQRRLTAIISADVAGYSPPHGSMTTAVPYALKAHRRELIDPKIIEYGGRIVKTTGDGLLLNSLAWWTRYVVPLMYGVEWPNCAPLAQINGSSSHWRQYWRHHH